MESIDTSKTAQEITDKIAHESGLVTNTADLYANPIYQSQMAGSFYRNLMRIKGFSWIRACFATIFFILPSLLIIFFLVSDIQNIWTSTNMLHFGTMSLFAILYFLVGLRILFPNKQS